MYTGMSIRTDKAGRLYLNQNQYLEEMNNVPVDAEAGKEDGLRTVLRGAVGRLLYLNLTRPDLSFRTNFLSRVPREQICAKRSRRPANSPQRPRNHLSRSNTES